MEIIGENVNIKKIAITGTIASGKSTLCDILAKRGAYVINTDNLIHNLYFKSKEIQAKVIKEFGERILSSDEIDRSKLAEIVFNDAKSLKKLESIIHPAAIEEIKQIYRRIKNLSKYKAFVVEFPLLYEIGFDTWFDKSVVVTCDPKISQERFDQVYGIGAYQARMKNHLTQDQKTAKADVIIENQGSPEQLESKVDRWIL